jgi:hypothetical protein
MSAPAIDVPDLAAQNSHIDRDSTTPACAALGLSDDDAAHSSSSAKRPFASQYKPASVALKHAGSSLD